MSAKNRKKSIPKSSDYLLSSVAPKFRLARVSAWVFALSVVGLVAFFLYKEATMPQQAGYITAEKKQPLAFKIYTNNYWGLSLRYPGNWFGAIGSYEDGKYYFASFPINFINELPKGEALISALTFNNWQKITFQEWLANRQNTNFKEQILGQKEIKFNNLLATEYEIYNPGNTGNAQYSRIVSVPRNTETIYEFWLSGDSQGTLEKYQATFQKVLDSVEFTEQIR